MIETSEVSATIRSFLQQEFPNQDVELTDETDLLEEWFVDSLAIVEIVMFLERQFHIDIDRADISGENFENIRTLTNLVAARMSDKD